jgi:DNA repair protein RadD
MPLRDYQQRGEDQLYQWFDENPTGNPCLVMPTGSGKSWVIADLCRDALQSWPTTRILILSHVKEILVQDLDKIFQVWPHTVL